MGYEVSGRTCLVTGSARGLGKEFAERLLRKGGKVCISDVDEDVGRETFDLFRSMYGEENVTFFM